jgi:hypothetical protein
MFSVIKLLDFFWLTPLFSLRKIAAQWGNKADCLPMMYGNSAPLLMKNEE